MRLDPPLLAAVLGLTLTTSIASAQPAPPSTEPAPLSAVSTEHAPGRPYFGPNEKFAVTTGAEIYATVCIGCHMAGGKGAVGAGAYPALAGNARVASAQYVEYIVINGQKAMPPFGNAFDDSQIAEIVNYVRSNFGNRHTDSVTAADVRSARPTPAVKP